MDFFWLFAEEVEEREGEEGDERRGDRSRGGGSEGDEEEEPRGREMRFGASADTRNNNKNNTKGDER